MKNSIVKQNNTHKAVLNNATDKIDIILKGFEIEDLKFSDELLYSIPKDCIDDLFSIFERYDEDNRINVAEANQALTN